MVFNGVKIFVLEILIYKCKTVSSFPSLLLDNLMYFVYKDIINFVYRHKSSNYNA